VAHYRLVSIHPWADGNGRMSRLVMNMLQWEFGLIPTKVLKEQKAEYIQALNDTRDQQDETIFQNVMLRLHNANLQSEIDAYLASQETDVPQGVLHNVADDLTDRQRNILDIIRNVAVNVAVNTKYLSERLGVNRKTIQRDAVALQEKHLIQWVGSDKTGHWVIIEK
jgi:Fic family protein